MYEKFKKVFKHYPRVNSAYQSVEFAVDYMNAEYAFLGSDYQKW